jgi:hypothetical protein
VTAHTLSWDPPVIYTASIAATANFLGLARKSGAGGLVDNTFSVQYAKDPASPRWASDPAMKLYRRVLSMYASQLNQDDGVNFYGVSAAEAFVELLYKAGPNPTRQSLLAASRNWNQVNPFLLPGNRARTDSRSQSPIRGEIIVRFRDGVFVPVSSLKMPKP